MVIKKQYSVLILFAHVLVLILYHIFGYAGHFGYDDLHYAKIANDLTQGIPNFGDHYFYRFTIVIFTAFSYLLFGINDFASSMPALCITILILGIVYFEVKNDTRVRISLALSLTLFSSWFIFYSDKLMPDIYLVLSVVLSLFLIRKYRFGTGKSSVRYALLLVFALFFGFLSKETIIFMVPLIIYLIASDLVKRRNIHFWFYTIVFGLMFLLLYFIIIQAFTGDFRNRFNVIADNSYLNLCSYDKQPVKMVLQRISNLFSEMMIYQGMIISLLFILVFLVQKKFKNFLSLTDPASYWISSSVILFLTSNFMTVSFSSYSPMCLDPRHYLFLVPVAAIPASSVLADFFSRQTNKIEVLITFSIVTLISFFLPGKSFQLHYLPVILVLFLSILSKEKTGKTKLNVYLFILCLMIMPVDSMIYARKINYRAQRNLIEQQVLNSSDTLAVVSDEVQKRLGIYFSGFKMNNNVQFFSFNEFTGDSVKDEKVILLLNAHTQYLSGINHESLPVYAKSPDIESRKVYSDSVLKIFMYKLQPGNLRKNMKIRLFSSVNDFETDYKNWDMNGNLLSDSVEYPGNKSSKIGEYSPLFTLSADTLDLQRFSTFEIECEAFINFESPTKANLVVDISGSELWKGIEINPFIKAYSNWWPVNYNLSYQPGEIKPGSQIRIYIWNIDRKPALVDNFKVEIFGNQ